MFVGCEQSVPLMSSDRSSREAMHVLNEIRDIVLSGIERKMLQTVPHIVLLSRDFYRKELRPALARWLLIWFGTKKLVGVPDDVVVRYLLRQDTRDGELKSLDDDFVKMLNLGREWLNSLLPFVLSKINRVNFGLLNPQDLERALSLDPRLPKSRRFLAVPFIGKDVPSRSSEFSHPDVLIGMSILAYRYQGLRPSDFKVVMTGLQEQMREENGAYKKRPTCKRWAKFVELAGGHLRGDRRKVEVFDWDNSCKISPKLDQKEEEECKKSVVLEAKKEMEKDDSEEKREFDDIWPLELVDVGDPEQMGLLYRLLYRLPHIVEMYLDTFIFPLTMEHAGSRLQATGQELGGDVLFPRRLGFSGTSNCVRKKSTRITISHITRKSFNCNVRSKLYSNDYEYANSRLALQT